MLFFHVFILLSLVVSACAANRVRRNTPKTECFFAHLKKQSSRLLCLLFSSFFLLFAFFSPLVRLESEHHHGGALDLELVVLAHPEVRREVELKGGGVERVKVLTGDANLGRDVVDHGKFLLEGCLLATRKGDETHQKKKAAEGGREGG